jgi:hypothetical protein
MHGLQQFTQLLRSARFEQKNTYPAIMIQQPAIQPSGQNYIWEEMVAVCIP